MTVNIPKPKSKFLKVECNKCEEQQIIFNSPAEEVNCNNCGETLAKSTGGKANVKAEIKKKLD